MVRLSGNYLRDGAGWRMPQDTSSTRWDSLTHPYADLAVCNTSSTLMPKESHWVASTIPNAKKADIAQRSSSMLREGEEGQSYLFTLE